MSELLLPTRHLFGRDLDALKRGAFEQHCLTMSIVKNDAGATTLSSSGFIRQNENGVLRFVLYVPGVLLDPFESLALPAGEIIPSENLYTLSATDVYGNTWKTPNVLPHVTATHNGSIISGEVSHLTAVTEARKARSVAELRLVFFEALDFPPTHSTTTRSEVEGREVEGRVERNVAKIACYGLDIEFVRRVDVTEVRVRSTDVLPRHLAVRVGETLQFVLAQELRPNVVSIVAGSNEETTLHSRDRSARPVRMPRAIEGYSYAEDFWRLFERYFGVVRSTAGERYHPLSAEWGAVVRSSQLSIESQILVLSVSVEGLLRASGAFDRYAPSSESSPQPTDGSEVWLEKLAAVVRDPSCPESIRNRVTGFLASYTGARAVDVLQAMAAAKVIAPQLVPVWKTARNPAAHGGLERTTDDLLRARFSLLSLVYQLVFEAVGYRGCFTDYGRRNFPGRLYPETI